LALDLVAKKRQVAAKEPEVAATEAAKEPDPVPQERQERESAPPISEELLAAAGVPRRRGRTWLVLLLLLAMVGAGVYLYRDRIPWQRLRSYVSALRAKLHH
jgi:hypothetical protein